MGAQRFHLMKNSEKRHMNISIIKEESSPHKLTSPLGTSTVNSRTRRSSISRRQTHLVIDTRALNDDPLKSMFEIKPMLGRQRTWRSDGRLFQIQEKNFSSNVEDVDDSSHSQRFLEQLEKDLEQIENKEKRNQQNPLKVPREPETEIDRLFNKLIDMREEL